MNTGTPLNKKLLPLAPKTGSILNDDRKGPKTPFPLGTVYTVLKDLSRIDASDVVDMILNDPENAIPLYIKFSTCLNTEGIKRTRDSLIPKDKSIGLTIASIFSPLTREESPGIPIDFEDALRSFSNLETVQGKVLMLNHLHFAEILVAISGLPPKLNQEATQLLLKLLIHSIEEIKNPKDSFIPTDVLKFVIETTKAEALKLQASVLDIAHVKGENADVNAGITVVLSDKKWLSVDESPKMFISCGGQGIVFEGRLSTSNQKIDVGPYKKVVTKRILTKQANITLTLEHILNTVGREIQLGRQLGNDPHVVAAYRLVKLTFKKEQTFHHRDIKTKKSLSTTKSKEAFYVIMDLFKSRELRDAPLVLGDPNACDYVTYQVLQSLKYCHDRGVVHRDLKFENILFNGPTIRLIDFDLAKVRGVLSNDALGTLEYIAPEMAKGKSHDDKVDSWSLGCLIFELLTGHPPVHLEDDPTPLQILSRIVNDPIDFDELNPEDDDEEWEVNKATIKLCKDLLEKNPKNRPSITKLYSNSYEGKRHPFLEYMEEKSEDGESIEDEESISILEFNKQAFLEASEASEEIEIDAEVKVPEQPKKLPQE